MSYYDNNIYYSPEKFGLSVVAEAGDPNACYSFDDIVVWEKDGQLYWATDSGCSCPTPFEDYRKIEDLTKLEWKEFENFVDNNWLTWGGRPDTQAELAEKGELKIKVIKKMQELGL